MLEEQAAGRERARDGGRADAGVDQLPAGHAPALEPGDRRDALVARAVDRSPASQTKHPYGSRPGALGFRVLPDTILPAARFVSGISAIVGHGRPSLTCPPGRTNQHLRFATHSVQLVTESSRACGFHERRRG
jgi:hypothetical protein